MVILGFKEWPVSYTENMPSKKGDQRGKSLIVKKIGLIFSWVFVSNMNVRESNIKGFGWL